MSGLAARAGAGGPGPEPASEAPSRAAAKTGRAAAYAGALALAAALGTPVIGYVGDLALAPFLGLLGLLALPLLFAPGARRGPDPAFALLALLLVLALASVAWSLATPGETRFVRYKDVESLIPLKLCFEFALYGAFYEAMSRLRPGGAARALLALATGVLLLCALEAAEALDGARLYRLLRGAARQGPRADIALRDAARGCYVALVLYWPAAVALAARGRVRMAAAGGALLLLGALRFRVDAVVAAALLSTVAAAAVLRAPRRAPAAIGALGVLYLLVAPLAAQDMRGTVAASVAKASWDERIRIWRTAAGLIARRPVEGWGLDASRALAPEIPVHPHDAALQVWLELGAGGALLACLFFVLLAWRIGETARRDARAGAAAAGALVAYTVVGALSFGVWQEWWLALAALAATACGLLAKSLGAAPPPTADPGRGAPAPDRPLALSRPFR